MTGSRQGDLHTGNHTKILERRQAVLDGAALKCLYLVVRSLDLKGTGQERWMNRWKPALNAFAITFEGGLF